MTMARNSRVLQIICFTITACFLPPLANAKYAGGTGEPNDPYLIYTPEQMNTIGTDPNDWDKHFKLMADIDLAQYTGEQFNIIARNFDGKPFTGIFDGNGKTISNFTYISSDAGNDEASQHIDKGDFGLFGYAKGACVKDLRVNEPNIIVANGHHIGVLAGRFYSGAVTRCSVEGGRISGIQYVGGLIGSNSSSITECSSSTTVSAKQESGGLVGENSGTISFCHTAGNVEGDIMLGGLVGRNLFSVAVISQCHSSSVIRGRAAIGGLVGSNDGGRIDLCYSLGCVNGHATIGGLCGRNEGTVSSSYSASDVIGTDENTGGLIGYNYGNVIGCKATGNVQGVEYVGGLVAQNHGYITHCYARGSIQGDNGVAGLVAISSDMGQVLFSYSTGPVSGNNQVSGFSGGGSTYLCYWDTETSKTSESAAGKGKTTAQMQGASTYRGWGYESRWVLDEGRDYPHLIWEVTPGDLLVNEPRSYGGGTGESNNPYQIHTAQQFVSIAYYPDDYGKNFILTNDINLGTIGPDEMIPIGTDRLISHSWRVTIGSQFEGSFDGNWRTISNFKCRESGQDFIGLFGYIGQTGQIKNLYIENITVSGRHHVGGLAGHNLGIIQRCSIEGRVEGGTQVGGLAGSNEGTIIECSASGEIEGNQDIGGIVGYNNKDVSVSSSISSVKGNETVGGIVGRNGYPQVWTSRAAPPPGFVPSPADCNVSSCYSLGSAEGEEQVGGLVGENGGYIEFCYSATNVRNKKLTSDDHVSVGGLVGKNNYGVILSSYWDIDTSGQSFSDGGTSKTTSEMQTASTFLEAGWDFVGETANGAEDIWWILEGQDYPRLWWEDR